MSEKKKFRDIHGKTRVGLWLKEKAPNVLRKALDIAGDLVPGGSVFKTVVEGILKDEDELNPDQMAHAIMLLEFDMEEMREITKRLQSDNEHVITRLVRPASYIAMFIMFLFCVFLDGNIGDFKIEPKYIPVIESIFWIQTTFYFGSRGAEKIAKTFKKSME